MDHCRCLSAAVAICTSFAAPVEAFVGTFEVLPIPVGFYSRTARVSGDGQTVVGITSGSAYRWTRAGGLQSLPFSSIGGPSSILGTTFDGSSSILTTPISLLRWTSAGVTPLEGFAGYSHVTVSAVSKNSTALLGEAFDEAQGRTVRYLWTQGTGARELSPALASRFSSINLVSDDGTVVVGSQPGQPGPVRWDGSNQTALGAAQLMVPDGSTVWGTTYSGSAGTLRRWSIEDGNTSLGSFSANYLEPFSLGDLMDISGDGQSAVGYTYDNTETFRGWVRQVGIGEGARPIQSVFREVGLEGLPYLIPTGISADGNIIVGGGVPGTQLWIATIPTPSAGVAIAMMAFAGRRRWRP